ncbi:hypothetical protein [uncultured Tenacibaculum sp.]|uniref:HYC_CC_PP family protein n=1 Tax=uncultured Tenacibaculum sp. TaxID=174713 RepID=UPI0026254DDD|nr:hypothetical protein [uncultured Tenacibaculum sp.]
MKSTGHKMLSFLMAFVVVFSTMSFSIDMHYCGDTLVDSTMFGSATNCGMEMEKTSTKECSISKKNCCNDKQISVEGQDELKTSFDFLTKKQQLFALSFVYTYANLFIKESNNNNSYKDYTPPLVVKAIYKLDETYLI